MRISRPEREHIYAGVNLGNYPAYKCYVFSYAFGWGYCVEYGRVKYEHLTWNWKGWRPTERWAARVAARKHTRYLNNWASYSESSNSNPYDILSRDPNEVKRVTKNLVKTVKELTE